MNNLTDLETKGYVVIPNFLDKTIIDQAIADYNVQKQIALDNGFDDRAYKTIYTYISLISGLDSKIQNLLTELSSQTNITANVFRNQCEYFDNSYIKFEWHQDHDPYYNWQTGYNSLNLWIPIIKPNTKECGLMVVPHTKIQEFSRSFFKNHIFNSGAKRFESMSETSCIMNDDESGTTKIVPINFNNLSEVPELGAGDLLLMRNDVLHSTQVGNDHRVAISIRCTDGNTKVYRDKFYNQCQIKKIIMEKNKGKYQKTFNYFETYDVDYVTAGEVLN
ncbi:hypothetical protein UFOVP257_256 [uncultured Caudovirales phage]|uniref:Phytanoyl-CoA dioxygenase n=1 Tax=uncultured Caudovirales phage TaxID=2100421 RepID=A0A6J5LG28_9CAUD|nr:hypothetical protein UFOVP257_256 [uncultured Caudovirales phage]